MPARPTEHKDDLLGWARADRPGKLFEFDLEERDGDASRQVEDCLARCRVDETDQVAPGEAVLDGSNGALVANRPDFVHERLKSDTMLIDRPQFYPAVREGGCYLPQ